MLSEKGCLKKLVVLDEKLQENKGKALLSFKSDSQVVDNRKVVSRTVKINKMKYMKYF